MDRTPIPYSIIGRARRSPSLPTRRVLPAESEMFGANSIAPRADELVVVTMLRFAPAPGNAPAPPALGARHDLVLPVTLALDVDTVETECVPVDYVVHSPVTAATETLCTFPGAAAALPPAGPTPEVTDC